MTDKNDKPTYQELENQNKKFANELLTANKKINEAQNIAHLGIWELDIVNNKLSWSDEIFRIFDCEPDKFEASYEAFLEFVYPEDRDKVNIAYKNSLKTKTSYEIEHRLLTKTKSIKYVKERCITDFDKNGRPVRSFGIVIDITSEKQLIENLYRSEILLKSSIESPKDMIILSLDKDYRYMYFNEIHKEAMHHVFGTQPQIGNCIFDFIKGKDTIENAKSHYDRALSGEGHISIEEHIKDHMHYYFETQYNPVYDQKNEIIGITAFAQNITERKKDELELLFHSQILKNIGDGVILIEAETGKIVFCNSAFENIFGYDTDELLGKHIQIVNAPTDKTPNEIATEIIEQLNKLGKWEGEIANIKKDKTVFYCSATVSTFEHPKYGNVWISIHKDITDQKETEQVLKESEMQLKELNATKNKFFSIISHDLKSPFNSILGFSNILVNNIKDKDYTSILRHGEIIQQASQKAMDLLVNLIEWSKSQTNRIEFSPEFIDLVKILNNTVALAKYSAQKKLISISMEFPEKAPLFADKAMIETIARNLITNAIKFTNQGGKIVLSVENKSNECLISVSDNGVGIKREALDKLFMIDESISTKGTQEETGTGLGLILCKEFILKHGGKIWAESEPGAGSTFIVILPIEENHRL